MTSLLFWRTRSFQSAPPRKCCHGNSKGPTLELLLSNNFLYIFRKSQQIWLNYLSPSLSYGQQTSRVVPNTPPPHWMRKLYRVNRPLDQLSTTKKRLFASFSVWMTSRLGQHVIKVCYVVFLKSYC